MQIFNENEPFGTVFFAPYPVRRLEHTQSIPRGARLRLS